MSVFTVFFCGTGSNSFDTQNKNYPKGEIISTLASHHKGTEFVDWLACDGPGSGNLQEDEKWVVPGNYSQLRGTLTGAGWVENVNHAIAVLKCELEWKRVQLTKQDYDKLKSAKVPIEDAKAGGSWYWRTYEYPNRKVTPQDLQLQKAKIFRKGKPPSKVNIIGWSRGGVSCHMLANAMAKDSALSGIPVNIFAVDPVPGTGNFQKERCSLAGNVKNYVSVYARDERSKGFAPIVPKCASATSVLILPFPGRHATVAGNGAVDGADGAQGLPHPGALVRGLAEKFLTEWGTQLDKRSGFGKDDINKMYDAMKEDAAKYQTLRTKVYTTAENSNGERYIGLGEAGKGAAFSAAKDDGWEAPKGLSMSDEEVCDFLIKL